MSSAISISTVITPADLPPRQRFFKLTNLDELHNGFHYTTGLNTDTVSFNPTGECSSGGLYFFDESQLKYFLTYTVGVVYIREVTFPVDARIYCETNKYKCDKFIIGERKQFYLDEYLSNEEILTAVNGGMMLEYVKVQTSEICIAAVNKCGRALKYVKVQTSEICIAAVQQDGRALRFVHQQTSEICIAAVNKWGRALKYVKVQTSEICIAAVQQDGRALRFVHQQTPEICLEAVQHGRGVRIEDQQKTQERREAAVQQDGRALQFVHQQTPEICLEAVQKDGRVLKYVEKKTPEICLAACRAYRAGRIVNACMHYCNMDYSPSYMWNEK
uniref:DUF4116 domain-containing protein n=1 Tax=Marseillevirus LCMAC201 TaxID=2506605 RepID=A0A481YYH8_9VIRU|nr:MAG: protein of unknown function DUF4116 [Marseillevirus LCMAC201]